MTAILGTIATLAIFLAIRQSEARIAELHFATMARDRLQAINSEVRNATDVLYALRALFESARNPVSSEEYDSFSYSLRERVVGLRDTGWAPRVLAADRAAFERKMQAEGLSGFQIVEMGSDGKLVRAEERAVYFPVLFADPNDASHTAVGFDLLSETERHRVVSMALTTGEPAATSPINLITVPTPNGGVMAFVAVRNRDDPAGSGPQSVTGIVFAVFETARMIENIFNTKVNVTQVEAYIYSPEAAKNKRFIYWHSPIGRPTPTEDTLAHGVHWRGTLELVDQHWGVVFTAAGRPEGEAGDGGGEIVLIGGLIMTASLVGYLWLSLRRTLELELLTASLNKATGELRRNAARLDYMARHDALTGLTNRAAFRAELSRALEAVAGGHDLTVLYLDLDRFKAVNDTMGHAAGDRLLHAVADRLRDAVREGDVVARLGGDEFAIALAGLEQPRSAEELARRIIDTVGRPYEIDGHAVDIGVSVGIASAGAADRDGDELLRRADVALYAAKREGRGLWRRFHPAMDDERGSVRTR